MVAGFIKDGYGVPDASVRAEAEQEKSLLDLEMGNEYRKLYFVDELVNSGTKSGHLDEQLLSSMENAHVAVHYLTKSPEKAETEKKSQIEKKW